MTALDHFRRMMQQRRKYNRGSAEWTWRTNAARKYLLLHRKVPTQEWGNQ